MRDEDLEAPFVARHNQDRRLHHAVQMDLEVGLGLLRLGPWRRRRARGNVVPGTALQAPVGVVPYPSSAATEICRKKNLSFNQ